MIYDSILKIPESLFFETEVKVIRTRKKMIHFTEELKNRLAIYNFLCQHGKTLRSDKDFRKQIRIKHLDTSEFNLPLCAWDESEDKIFIWTEHCGYLYFYKEDLEEMDVQEWRWKGFPVSEDEKENWEMIEHNIFIFNMEVKLDAEEQKEEKL